MTEGLEFNLSLTGDLSKKASDGAASLRKLEADAKKARDAVSFHSQVEKTEAALRKLTVDPAGFQKLVKAQAELIEQRKKLSAAVGAGKESFTEALAKNFQWAAFSGEVLAEGVMKAGEFLVEAAHKVVEVIIDGFKDAVKVGAREQVLRLGENLTLGGKKEGLEFREDSERVAKTLGLSSSFTRKQMLGLRRSGLDQDWTRSIFGGAADIAAQSGEAGNKDAIASAVEMFKKVKLKEGVTSRQLESLGIVSNTVFDSLAKSMGITREEAKKAAKGGNTDPGKIIAAILAGVAAKNPTGQLAAGGVGYAGTMQSKLELLKELPEKYFEKFAESPAFDHLSDVLGNLLEKLSPESPAGKRIFAGLEKAFTNIVDWIAELGTDEGIKKLTDGLESALAFANGVVSAVKGIVEGFKAIWDFGPAAGTLNALKAQQAGTAQPNAGLIAAVTGIEVPASAMKASGSGRAAVAVTVTNNTTLHAKTDDPKEHGKIVGEHQGREVAKATERAAQEAGM